MLDPVLTPAFVKNVLMLLGGAFATLIGAITFTYVKAIIAKKVYDPGSASQDQPLRNAACRRADDQWRTQFLAAYKENIELLKSIKDELKRNGDRIEKFTDQISRSFRDVHSRLDVVIDRKQ